VPPPVARFLLSWNRFLGATLGLLVWHIGGSLRRVSLINLQLCYPELSVEERHKIAKSSLIETGRGLTESAWVWLRSPDTLYQRTRIALGESIFRDALASSQGLLIATPHLGNWEACSIILAREQLMTYLYRPPRAKWLEPLIIRWRANFNARPARLDAGGIRDVLKQLRSGNLVGVLPDQEPDLSAGLFAPLFGEPANTMTLLQKLGRRGQAKVLFCVCERESGGKGWALSFIEPETDLLHEDPLIAATAMNKSIERCIALNPSQYLWSYKRFGLLESGGRRRYR